VALTLHLFAGLRVRELPGGLSVVLKVLGEPTPFPHTVAS
jgi:hypothetical protein